MWTTPTSASLEAPASVAVRSRRPPGAVPADPNVQRLKLLMRGVLDCAYLIRTPQSLARKLRVLWEYARMTLMLLLSRHPGDAGTARILNFRVRHFGYASLHFLFREIFVRSDYLFRADQERSVIFDCGANIGVATLFFKWHYPHSEIHAFEADPQTFAALKDNVERNALTDVHLHNVALCDRNETVDFFVASNPGSFLMSLVPERLPQAHSRRITVNGCTLSSFTRDREIDFMKLDIEGAEDVVLQELFAHDALRRVRRMAIEYHHNLPERPTRLGGFLNLLDDAGFRYQLDVTSVAGATDESQDVLIRAQSSNPITARGRIA